MEIEASTLLDIQVTISRCKDYFVDVDRHDAEINKLRLDLQRIESDLQRTTSSSSRSDMKLQDINNYFTRVDRLEEWKKAADSRMDKIASGLINAIIGATVAFVGAAVWFYITNAKPAKATIPNTHYIELVYVYRQTL